MNKLGILEGLLYVQGDEGLSLPLMMEILEVSEEEALLLVKALKERYQSEEYGLRINFLGNTFKLVLKKNIVHIIVS